MTGAADADGLYSQALVACEQGRIEDGVALVHSAIALAPEQARLHRLLGMALSRLGRNEDALESLERALALDPASADVFGSRADVLVALGRLDAAVESYDRALALSPGSVEDWCNRGAALIDLTRHEDAIASFERAIALSPDFAPAHYNHGNALAALERHHEALASFDKAIALAPDYADAYNNRADALDRLDRRDEALASAERALSIDPAHGGALVTRAIVLRKIGRHDEALASCDRALSLMLDNAGALTARADILIESKRFDEALTTLDRLIRIAPPSAHAFYNRGNVLREVGRQAEAAESYRQAVTVQPEHVESRFAICMAELPVLYEDEPEIARRRQAYQNGLAALSDDVRRGQVPGDPARAVGAIQPFFLPYQGCNDRDLQALYGSMVCRIMAERYPPPQSMATPPGLGEPTRVGIVSGYFHDHSNWKIPIKGWLTQLDRSRFRLFGYYTRSETDSATEFARARCHRFVQGPLPLEAWRSEILGDAPHVLIYPEVGMDPDAVKVAALRLAPVQCNSWGHPETSGFPTLDYFLSSDLMEPADGDDHYTERLVRLSNLSIYYEPVDMKRVALDRRQLGLRPTSTVFWCGQSLFKYLPQFDEVFPHIARQVGDCQFAFIQYPGAHANAVFGRRLERAFGAFGLRATDHCVVLPRLDQNQFGTAIGLCDIVLDSIGWSGCNSTLESLAHDLPIVTMAGSFMRGRHGMAILTMMDMTETVCRSIDDYISIAVRLAQDRDWRSAVRRRMSESKHRLYRDRACILALEAFLDEAVRGKRQGARLMPAREVND
ncbi:MAG: tetratricopeptide repeat protein [Xanthobacteraceae bacterium]